MPVLLLLALMVPCVAEAHKPSDSYLNVQVEGAKVSGQWDIALRDLDHAIGLDSDGDGSITWGELRAQAERVSTYAFGRLALGLGEQACPLRLVQLLADHHTDGAYAVLRFAGSCGEGVAEDAPLQVRYGLLFDVDPQHRGLVRVSFERETELRSATGYDAELGALAAMQQAGRRALAIFSPDHPAESFARNPLSYSTEISEFFLNGVWHIWTGFDHILFLVSLLLPAVLRRKGGAWRSVADFHDALVHTLKVVTAFTVAHSITLSAAALGVVDLPSRLVESLIALSVAVAALNNVYAIFDQRLAWRVAFFFGLIHGFGFASVLVDLGLGHGSIVVALVSFNLGVEAGQIAIVSLLLPFAFWIRDTALFRWGVVTAGSTAIVAVSLGWLTERALNVAIF